MSLEARMSEGDPRLYNPGRDVAHCFDQAVSEVQERLLSGSWVELDKLLKELGVTKAEVGQTIESFSNFVAGATEIKKESIGQCIERVGFNDKPFGARLAVLATLGMVMGGFYYAGARSTTIGGVGPTDMSQYLREAGRQTHMLMTMPRWRRPFYRAAEAFRRSWRALRNTD